MEENRKRRAREPPHVGGKLPSPSKAGWGLQSFAHGAVMAVIDKHTALLLLPAIPSPAKFAVRGRLTLWPLMCASCRVSDVEVSWERALELGGVAVFSPTSHALQQLAVSPHTEAALDAVALSVRIRQAAASPLPEDLEARLNELLVAEPCPGAAVLLRSRASPACDAVCSLPRFEALFSLPDPCSRHLTFQLELAEDQPFRLSFDRLQEAAECVVQHCRENPKAAIVVIGGKDVGKSSAARFLINTLLLTSGCSHVGLLDCDVGQSEMTPAEFLSLSKIESPLFGPPFTHADQWPLESCFLGQLSPNDDPELYLGAIERLVSVWRASEQPGPLIVNTMGWPKGLGRMLLVDTLRMLQPQAVIQLQHENSTNNFAELMTADLVMRDRGWASGYAAIDLKYQLLIAKLDLTSRPPFSRPLSPYEHREATMLGHLSNLVKEEAHLRRPLDGHAFGGRSLLLSLTSAVPRRVPYNRLVLHAMNADRQLPAASLLLAMNGALVALCCLSPEALAKLVRPEEEEDLPRTVTAKPLCQALGVGLVRGIDPVAKELLVVTGVPAEQLSRVNCLLRGGMELPSRLGEKARVGPTPYFEETAASGIGCTGLRKERAHFQLRKKPH